MDSENLYNQYFTRRALYRYFVDIRYRDIYDSHYLSLKDQVATIPYNLVCIVLKIYEEMKRLKYDPKYKKPGLTKEETRLYLSSTNLYSFVRTTFRTQLFKQELLTKTISSAFQRPFWYKKRRFAYFGSRAKTYRKILSNYSHR